MKPRTPLAFAVLSALAAPLFAACATDASQAGVQVFVTSDIAAPVDLKEVGLIVRSSESAHTVLYARRWLVREKAAIQLPATFGIAPSEGATFTIEVVGYRDDGARRVPFVLASATVKPPETSVRRLDIPLYFDTWGSAKEGSGGGLAIQSIDGERGYPDGLDYTRRCPFGTTAHGVGCIDDARNAETLPVWNAEEAFGASSASAGRCFDSGCFTKGTRVPATGCTIKFASSVGITNLAAEFTLGGTTRLVPIVAGGDAGWSADAEQIKLPAALCAMAAPDPVLTAVFVDSVCNARPASMPVCGGATAPQNPYGDPSQPPLATFDAGPTDTDGAPSLPIDAGTRTDARIDGPVDVPIDGDAAVVVDASIGPGGPMKDAGGVVITPGP
jgi:hypothetical protein